MIELGIPMLIIATLVLNMFAPKLVPLVGLLMSAPLFPAFLIMTMRRMDERAGNQASKRKG